MAPIMAENGLMPKSFWEMLVLAVTVDPLTFTAMFTGRLVPTIVMLPATLKFGSEPLTEVEAKLDKALLAQDVAELAASQTALRQELADLNTELDHKQPLFHQSVNVNRQLLGLDERLRSLSIERDKLTVQLQALVAELARAREGHAARGLGAPEDLVKLTGE